MHRQLWWCLVGVITIVQCIFGALFLGLGCNIFLVLRLWCYALSAISRRLPTAVAHLLYKLKIPKELSKMLNINLDSTDSTNRLHADQNITQVKAMALIEMKMETVRNGKQ